MPDSSSRPSTFVAALSGSYGDDEAGRTLRLWDVHSGVSRALTGHTSWVNAVAVLSDGRRALSGSQDWSVRVWDLARGASLAAFVGDATMTCVAATPTHLLAGSAKAPSISSLCP